MPSDAKQQTEASVLKEARERCYKVFAASMMACRIPTWKGLRVLDGWLEQDQRLW